MVCNIHSLITFNIHPMKLSDAVSSTQGMWTKCLHALRDVFAYVSIERTYYAISDGFGYVLGKANE